MRTKVLGSGPPFTLAFQPHVDMIFGSWAGAAELATALSRRADLPPMLFVQAADTESACEPAVWRELASDIGQGVFRSPHVSTTQIRGSKHSMHKSHPAEFAATVIDWIVSPRHTVT